MKVFVSGVAGLVGSHLADALIEAGHDVVGCDNLTGGYLDNVAGQVEFHECDVIDLAPMVKITRGCELVYHCAATAYEGLSVFSPHFVTKNIVQASVSLITAAISNGARRFVFCSSMARYGTQDRVPFTEDMLPQPQDPYGIAKYSVELLLRNLCQVHGMEYVVVVPHNIIGPRQKYDDPYRSVASIMINLMLQNRQPIIYGDGTQKRCFSFVQDVVDPLMKVGISDGLSGEIINLGPDDDFITINELAAKIAQIIEFDLDPLYVGARPQEVHLANCSADKARALLDYAPRVDLESGLRSIVGYIQAKGVKPFEYRAELEITNSMTPRTWKDRLF